MLRPSLQPHEHDSGQVGDVRSLMNPSDMAQILHSGYLCGFVRLFIFTLDLRLTTTKVGSSCSLVGYLPAQVSVLAHPFSAGVVVSGVGMSSSIAACLSGIYLCIFL